MNILWERNVKTSPVISESSWCVCVALRSVFLDTRTLIHRCQNVTSHQSKPSGMRFGCVISDKLAYCGSVLQLHFRCFTFWQKFVSKWSFFSSSAVHHKRPSQYEAKGRRRVDLWCWETSLCVFQKEELLVSGTVHSLTASLPVSLHSK